MKLTLMLCIAFVLGMAPISVTHANEPEYEPVFIPKCEIYTLKSGKEICGFEAAVWFGQVLTVDADLVHAKAQLKNEQARSAELSLQVDVLRGQLAVHHENRRLQDARDEKLVQQIIDLDKKFQDERVKPRLGDPLAWTVTAVAAAVLTGIVIKDFAD